MNEIFPPQGYAGGRIKGAAVREFAIWMRGRLGEARSREIVARLPPELRAVIDPNSEAFGILASAWYSGDATNALLDLAVEGLSRAETQRFAEEGVTAALNVTLRGVHRALLRLVMSPSLHRRFAQRLWDAHFDGGRVVVTELSPTSAEVAYFDWPAHHPVLCEMCTASDLVIYGAMGLKDVRSVGTACVDLGDDRCAHVVSWSEKT